MKEPLTTSLHKLHYINSPDGLVGIYVIDPLGDKKLEVAFTDHLGSITTLYQEATPTFEATYDAFGNRNISIGTTAFTRGYCGVHQHYPLFDIIDMGGRMYDPIVGRFLSPDPFVQDWENSQNFNRYSYCLNNPLKYTDPSGEFFTWSFSLFGFSFGFNFTPLGIPLGFGFNIGKSMGIYAEVGYRVGGTGFGSGCTYTQSLNYNVDSHSFGTSFGVNAYASFANFNAGISLSKMYDFTNHEWGGLSFNGSVGCGVGNWEKGIGFNLGYGTDGFSANIGGFYDKHAWDSYPIDYPDPWSDGGDLQFTNNCYSFALDYILNGHYKGLQPGGKIDYEITLDNVLNAALKDGYIKKRNFFNKIGFGHRGYYEVYLVISNDIDYHWYRRNSGGIWSHKPGTDVVKYLDASGNIIKNPAKANHNYPEYQYNDGGFLLWVKRH